MLSGANKLAAILLGILLLVSFLNRGQFVIGSGPSGAQLTTAYYGYIK